jgi:hypothetical protein
MSPVDGTPEGHEHIADDVRYGSGAVIVTGPESGHSEDRRRMDCGPRSAEALCGTVLRSIISAVWIKDTMTADEFIHLNKQGVRSTRGFEVQFTGRFSLEYRDTGRKISISVSPGRDLEDKFCVVVASNIFERWDDEPDDALIPEADRLNLFENLRQALSALGATLIVDDHRVTAEEILARFPNSKLRLTRGPADS